MYMLIRGELRYIVDEVWWRSACSYCNPTRGAANNGIHVRRSEPIHRKLGFHDQGRTCTIILIRTIEL